MRIVQLIDSLDVGGAERMAVNFANALARQISFSGLVVTRKEGSLKSDIGPETNYLFLNKRKTIDIGAVFRFRSYCQTNKIDVVHAHGSSFFTAFLLKAVLPKIQIIWHDHNGARDNQSQRQNLVLSFCSRWFVGIIVVNHKLQQWSREHLGVKDVIYLPNFTATANATEKNTMLKGNPGKRILYTANLRHPKNHAMVLCAAIEVRKYHPDWSFHFVGNDLNDAYSENLKKTVDANDLHGTVYIYGLRTDTAHIIAQAEIGLIASTYEGLPLSLLEYGSHSKAVVVTNVGEIPKIIENGKNGLIVAPDDTKGFCDAILKLIGDEALRKRLGDAFYETVERNHSEDSIVGQYLRWVKTIL